MVVAMEIHNSKQKRIEHKQNFVKRHTQKLLFDRCSVKKLGFPYLILRRKAEHQAVGKCEMFSPLIIKFGCRKRKTNNFTYSHHVKIESHNNENQNKIKQWHVLKASSSKYTSLGSVAIVEQSQSLEIQLVNYTMSDKVMPTFPGWSIEHLFFFLPTKTKTILSLFVPNNTIDDRY